MIRFLVFFLGWYWILSSRTRNDTLDHVMTDWKGSRHLAAKSVNDSHIAKGMQTYR